MSPLENKIREENTAFTRAAEAKGIHAVLHTPFSRIYLWLP